MDEENYQKLKTRLSGAIWNAIRKDPDVSYSVLKKAFFEVCHRFIMRNKLENDLEWEMPKNFTLQKTSSSKPSPSSTSSSSTEPKQ